MFRYRSRSDGSEVTFARRPADMDGNPNWELVGDEAEETTPEEAPSEEPAAAPAAKKATPRRSSKKKAR